MTHGKGIMKMLRPIIAKSYNYVTYIFSVKYSVKTLPHTSVNNLQLVVLNNILNKQFKQTLISQIIHCYLPFLIVTTQH